MPITHVTLSGHCTGTGAFLLWSCLRVGDAHWCPLPFEIILVHNFLFLVKENKAFNIGMGPKTCRAHSACGKSCPEAVGNHKSIILLSGAMFKSSASFLLPARGEKQGACD